MAFFDRRRFLLAAAAATLANRHSFGQIPEKSLGHAATIMLHPEEPGAAVPANFLGLSYETLQLSDPSFFSPHNRELIAQFRKLAPHGVLRIGGNTSDVSWWKATADAQPTEFHVRTTPGEPSARQAFSIGPEAVRSLRGFLDASGWTCIYGINLGTSTPSRAAEQAVFVAKVLGDKPEYFQLGNEPDLYVKHLRDPQTWTADAYLDEWLAMANAILAVVPSASLGCPTPGANPTGTPRLKPAWPQALSCLPSQPSRTTTISAVHLPILRSMSSCSSNRTPKWSNRQPESLPWPPASRKDSATPFLIA